MAYATLAQGSSVTVNVNDQFDGVEVINRPQDLATIALTSGAWRYGSSPQQHSGGKVYSLSSAGPLTLTAVSGPLQYEVTDSPDNRVAQSFTAAETSSIRLLAAGAGIPWASRVAASTAGVGALMWADLGNSLPPVLMRGDGTYWKPLFRTVLLRKTALTNGLAQTADQIIGQLGPLPAGVLYPGAVFGLRYGIGRDVGTDAYGSTTAFRIGTAGTTADTLVSSQNLSGTFTAAGSALSLGIDNWSVMTSVTACARAGLGNAGASFAGAAASGAALLTAATISDVTSNALYFSISTTMATAAASKPQTSLMELILEP